MLAKGAAAISFLPFTHVLLGQGPKVLPSLEPVAHSPLNDVPRGLFVGELHTSIS